MSVPAVTPADVHILPSTTHLPPLATSVILSCMADVYRGSHHACAVQSSIAQCKIWINIGSAAWYHRCRTSCIALWFVLVWDADVILGWCIRFTAACHLMTDPESQATHPGTPACYLIRMYIQRFIRMQGLRQLVDLPQGIRGAHILVRLHRQTLRWLLSIWEAPNPWPADEFQARLQRRSPLQTCRFIASWVEPICLCSSHLVSDHVTC